MHTARTSSVIRAPRAPAAAPRLAQAKGAEPRMAAKTKTRALRLEGARQQALVCEYQPLVERLVQKALGKVGFCCEADELRSAASLGLLEAVARYDGARGIPFVAFAKHRITGAILDELRSRDSLARPSRQRAREVEQARQKLVKKLKREPTEAELAKASHEDLDTFRRRSARERAQTVVLLEDLPASAWTEVVAASAPSALDALCEEEERGRLAEALKRLPSRLQTILALYYQEELNYREIGEMLGVCESRICQLIKGAQKQLREMVAA